MSTGFDVLSLLGETYFHWWLTDLHFNHVDVTSCSVHIYSLSQFFGTFFRWSNPGLSSLRSEWRSNFAAAPFVSCGRRPFWPIPSVALKRLPQECLPAFGRLPAACVGPRFFVSPCPACLWDQRCVWSFGCEFHRWRRCTNSTLGRYSSDSFFCERKSWFLVSLVFPANWLTLRRISPVGPGRWTLLPEPNLQLFPLDGGCFIDRRHYRWTLLPGPNF